MSQFARLDVKHCTLIWRWIFRESKCTYRDCILYVVLFHTYGWIVLHLLKLTNQSIPHTFSWLNSFIVHYNLLCFAVAMKLYTIRILIGSCENGTLNILHETNSNCSTNTHTDNKLHVLYLLYSFNLLHFCCKLDKYKENELRIKVHN